MSNLLQKASIVTTPTAYGVGVLNSIKPAYALGEELVTNGNFATDSDWTKETGWTISGGTASRTNTGTYTALQQNILTIEKKYEVTIQIKSVTSGSLFGIRLGTNYILQGVLSSTGVYKGTGIASNATLSIMADPTFAGSIDNVSVKEITDADFDFTRTSSATRVNPDYLIETVSINSANLVQNGNFSELSSELVVNGDFATDSDWSKGTGWSIINGKARASGVSGSNNLTQSGILTVGKTYKITITVSEYVSGSVEVSAGASPRGSMNANGTYTFYQVATPNTNFFIISQVFNGAIDNVSVKQVDPNDNWTLVGGSTITDTLNIISTDGSLSSGKQLNVLEIGKKYKYSFDITSYTSGSLFFIEGSTSVLSGLNATGTYTGQFISTGTSIEFKRGGVSNASFDNISVIEIQENGVPRLDYTNGTASILLEPQSTNLATYSQDFSQINSVNSTITINNNVSPNGLINGNLWLANSTASPKELDQLYAVTSGATYTESWFVKYKSLQFVQLVTTSATFGAFFGNFDLINGTKGNSNYTNCSIKKYPNGWYRISATQVANSTGTGRLGGLRMIASATASRGGNITTVGTEAVEVWGHQVEQQTFSTSLIPTSGSTVTRAAETLNNAANSDLINSTEGVLYAEISALANGGVGDRYITLGSGSSQNTIQLLFHNTANRVNFRVTKAGSLQVNISDFTFLQTDNLKIACKFKENDFALWINGVERVVDTSGETFSANTLQEIQFDSGTGASDFYGKCKTVAVFKEALSDTELACLTSTNNREIFLNYYYRMQYVGANTEALSCAEQTFNV